MLVWQERGGYGALHSASTTLPGALAPVIHCHTQYNHCPSGVIQATERDEHSYQEMIAHLPLCALEVCVEGVACLSPVGMLPSYRFLRTCRLLIACAALITACALLVQPLATAPTRRLARLRA
jgi:hypothetical protein